MATSLLFDGYAVGELEGIFEHQGMMFGDFRWTFAEDDSVLAERLKAFIATCVKWTKDADADPFEFDRFRDIVCAGKWRIRSDDREDLLIDEAPFFHEGLNGESSWRCAEFNRDAFDGSRRTDVP